MAFVFGLLESRISLDSALVSRCQCRNVAAYRINDDVADACQIWFHKGLNKEEM